MIFKYDQVVKWVFETSLCCSAHAALATSAKLNKECVALLPVHFVVGVFAKVG